MLKPHIWYDVDFEKWACYILDCTAIDSIAFGKTCREAYENWLALNKT